MFSSAHDINAERRYRIARPARTKDGPEPCDRHACSVRDDNRSKSAACISVRSLSSSADAPGLTIVFVPYVRDGTDNGDSQFAGIDAAI